MLEEIIEHHVRIVVALDLDDHAHAILVRLVPELGDALDLLLLDQFRHPLQQPRLVHLVGQLGDDDGLPATAFLRLHMGARPHHDPPPPGPIGLADTSHAIDDGGGRKVRPRDQFHEFLDPDLRPLDHRQTGLDDLAQVVRRDIGRHAHRDTRGTIDQQIGEARWQDLGLVLRLVVIRREFDGFLVQVLQQAMGDARHAHLGVTHGRRGVAVHGTEVTLPVHQHVAHGKRLRHAHDGVIDRHVAMGVVLTDDVAHHARRFFVGLVPIVP